MGLGDAFDNQAVGKLARQVVRFKLIVINAAVKIARANRLVEHRAADQPGYGGVQNARRNQIVRRRGGAGGGSGQIGQHVQAGVDGGAVALVKAVHGLFEHAGNHALAGPAVDENDGFGRVALGQNVAQRDFVNAPVAHDGHRIMRRVAPQHLRQQVFENHADGRSSAHQRHQRDRAAAPRRNQGGQREAVAGHLRPVGFAGGLEHGQIARRRQRLGREHFAVMPGAGLDQLLLAGHIDKGQRHQAFEQKRDIAGPVASVESHSAATVSAANCVPLGTMA